MDITNGPSYTISPENAQATQEAEGEMSLLLKWQNSYGDVHGYFATAVCFFGVCTNLINIIVLTRKSMRSATNCILTALAISDMLAMSAYLPFAIWMYIVFPPSPSPERNTLASAHFIIFYASISVLLHTISIWLTVTLAVFRYIYIRFPQHGMRVCSLSRAKFAVFCVYLVSLIISIPNFVLLHIIDEFCDEEPGVTVTPGAKCYYVVTRNETESDIYVEKVNFWFHALLIRLLPCFGLTIMSILLVRTMKQVDEKRRQMGNQLLPRTSEVTQTTETARDRRTQRTTMMLVAVVVLFLVTEFPQGIIALLSGLLKGFFQDVYSPLGDTMDILTILNGSINFILYCTMSKQFRDTFSELFWTSVKRPNLLRSRSSNSSPNSVNQYTNGRTKITNTTV